MEKQHDYFQWDESPQTFSQNYALYRKHFVEHILSHGLSFEIKDQYYLIFSEVQEKLIAHAIDQLQSLAQSKEDVIDLYHVGGILFGKQYEKDNGGVVIPDEELHNYPDSACLYWQIQSKYLEKVQKNSLVQLAEKYSG